MILQERFEGGLGFSRLTIPGFTIDKICYHE